MFTAPVWESAGGDDVVTESLSLPFLISPGNR